VYLLFFEAMYLGPGNNDLVIAEERTHYECGDRGKGFIQRDGYVVQGAQTPPFDIVNALA
jgi:hypothetical protein